MRGALGEQNKAGENTECKEEPRVLIGAIIRGDGVQRVSMKTGA